MKQQRIDETIAALEKSLADFGKVRVVYGENPPRLVQAINIGGREYAHAISVPEGYFESEIYGMLDHERSMRLWQEELKKDLSNQDNRSAA